MSDSVGARSGLRRRKKLGKKSETFPLIESFLPDDVVTDILSRLSAKDVLRCRCVCKRWRDVTSTSDFIDLHLRLSIPMILKEDHDGRVLLDRCWEPAAQTRSKIHKLYGPDDLGVLFSHNGLIVVAVVSESDSVFLIIYNPIYRDVLNIKLLSRQYFRWKVCGVFFHPVQKEYCILWQRSPSSFQGKFQCRILNLESDPKWRDIGAQNAGIWQLIEPVLIDKHLYWITHPSNYFADNTFSCDIMEYDIVKEEFRVIPFPARINNEHKNVKLVNNDGVLSVVQVLPSKENAEIKIWTLNDGDGEQLWMSCNYIVSSDLYSHNSVPKAIAFRNGELVLYSRRRLYACNLKLGTYRKFGGKHIASVFLPHVTSLVSLKNCKSNICVEIHEEEDNEPFMKMRTTNHRVTVRGEEIQP